MNPEDMASAGSSPAAIEAVSFGSVGLLIHHERSEARIVASDDCHELDWRTCLAELSFRYGDLGDIGEPGYDRDNDAWTWHIDMKIAGRD